MSEVNTGQHHFAMSGLRQAIHFIDNMLMRTACQLGSDMRNDAVAATKQAAILNLHVGTVATGESIEPGGYIDDSKA